MADTDPPSVREIGLWGILLVNFNQVSSKHLIQVIEKHVEEQPKITETHTMHLIKCSAAHYITETDLKHLTNITELEVNQLTAQCITFGEYFKFYSINACHKYI